MKRDLRLRRAADFARVRQLAGRGWAHPLLVVYAAPNDLDRTRVGITVSRRIGTAVVRNRVRRRLREALRQRSASLGPGRDVVVVARPPSARATWPDLNAALAQALARGGLLTAPQPTGATE